MLSITDYDTDGDGTVTPAELKAGNSKLYQASLDWSSGVKTEIEINEMWIKPAALEMPDSPLNRVLRDEVKAQGAHEVGVEENAAKIQELYRGYGIPITWDEALRLGGAVEMNTTSLADVEQGLDEQAMALYPGKPAGVKTSTWAQPYMSQYQNLLEVPEVGLSDPLLQTALGSGMTLGDFSDSLRAGVGSARQTDGVLTWLRI